MTPLYHALAFRETSPDGHSAWVVQGVEHNICAQAKQATDAGTWFADAVLVTIIINEKDMGREGLTGIQAPPQEFMERFEAAQDSAVVTSHICLDAAHVFDVEVRFEGDSGL